LILTAAGMIVLMAIGAIVIDLGMSWMLHRQEQNAADPGALAAAKYAPADDEPAMQAEACFYAQANGFFLGDPGCAAAIASDDLHVAAPPDNELAGEFIGHSGYVQVVIRHTHPSFFGQFFGRPFATVRTSAVAALTTGNSNTSSLVALGHSCTGGPDQGDSAISGGSIVSIFPKNPGDLGGYVTVNARCGNSDDVCENGSGQNALSISGELSAPYTMVTGGCAYNGTGIPQPECVDVIPCLDEGRIPLGDPLFGMPVPRMSDFPVPDCPDPTETNSPSDGSPCTLSGQKCPLNTCTMDPGVYYAGWDIKSNVRVVLKPGMYILAGFGIQLSNNSSLEAVTDVDALGNPIDARVTIYSTDGPNCPAMPKQCEGSININGQGELLLKATNSVTCQQVTPLICPWMGILLWQDGMVADPEDITINGGSDLVLSGTIYAPKSKVSIAGSNASTGCTETVPGDELACLSVQIIAEQWEIGGGAIVDMPYDPSELVTRQQRGLVY
jgi:hypothetical protein